jgi:hypothetical protein
MMMATPDELQADIYKRRDRANIHDGAALPSRTASTCTST